MLVHNFLQKAFFITLQVSNLNSSNNINVLKQSSFSYNFGHFLCSSFVTKDAKCMLCKAKMNTVFALNSMCESFQDYS